MVIRLCKPCFKRKKKFLQGGSILDRVISQASNQDQCLLYKLANYKKGGELIDAYNVGGSVEVEKLIREQFGQLMYQEGKGQIINRAEYLRWKFRDHEQVVLPIEASLSPHDPLAKWSDHEACWQMQYRGSLGETLLHVLIICDTKIHTRLARTLIKVFPKLAMDVVEGEEYLGASALHLAIAYFNNELVQDLVEAGANVNQRAIGSFFLPRDQQKLKPAKHTDYEGLAYLGEYPLAWAACCANESVYNLLLDSGANPDLQDNFGNMILHMVVVCDKLDMFGYALRHPKLPASNGIVNRAGLTPLTLACKLGRAEVFKEMLELSAKEFWRYSNITCSAYPLNALDTILPDGRTNYNSALFIILNGTKEEHLDMLDGGIIQRLLEEKWKTFARNQFLKRLLILMIHLIFLSLAVYLRPDDPDEPLLGLSDDVTVIARYGCEVGTVLGVLSYVIFQQGDEIKNQGLFTFLKQQSHSPAKAIFLFSNLLILAAIPFRLSGDRGTEEAILLFAVPGSWFLLMFFAGAVRLTGPFVTMIYSMITGDMLTFGIIYTIVLFGFSQSFYFLYKGFPGVKTSLYNSYISTWMALFQITMGNYDYQELSMTTYPGVSKTVFALFMVFVPILLLNMLIAMMGNTYAHVIEQSEKEWMKQWAKIVITLERAIPQTDAHHYLQEYSISLGPSEDPSTEQRGVMVIKSKNKTRAKQRKGAVSNWKRVCKVTITALKKRGLSGEELRCLMWGRESISTPIKTKRKPVTDPLMDPQGPNITGAFGGALTAALDVMAFTHEVDINGAAQGLNLSANPKQMPSDNKQQLSIPNQDAQNNFRNQQQNMNQQQIQNQQQILNPQQLLNQQQILNQPQMINPLHGSNQQTINQQQLNQQQVFVQQQAFNQHQGLSQRQPFNQQTISNQQQILNTQHMLNQQQANQQLMSRQVVPSQHIIPNQQQIPYQQQIRTQHQNLNLQQSFNQNQSLNLQQNFNQHQNHRMLNPQQIPNPQQMLNQQQVFNQQQTLNQQQALNQQQIANQQLLTNQHQINKLSSTNAAFNTFAQLTDSEAPPQIVTQMVPVAPSKAHGVANNISGLVSSSGGLSSNIGGFAANVGFVNHVTGFANQLTQSLMGHQWTDPLREIVLCSNENDCDPQMVNALAMQAANLPEVEEVVVKSNPSVKSIAGIFTGTETFVKKVEETLKKKYSALDPSDSDGFGEVPLLGRIARTRRAKSANQRGSAKSKQSDKRRLFKDSESSSSDTVINAGIENPERPDLDFAEERIRNIQEEMRNKRPLDDKGSMRPRNIDVAMGNEQICVTISESGIVQGEGLGADLKSLPSPSVKHKKKRPKTAKTNRVAPSVDMASRNCQSANKRDSDTPDSPPDPLEPWSTKGITNMNKILAWENDQDSM